jgi:hypothetical protein
VCAIAVNLRRAAVVGLGLCLACAQSVKHVRVRPPDRDEHGVSFLPFVSSAAERFAAANGNPCPAFSGRVTDNLIGWEAPTPEDAACTHDTLYDGLKPAVLELRWRAEPPADGTYDLVTLGYAVGAWGRVVTRGSHYGDYFAKAQVVIEARASHCSATWSKDLAEARVTGPIDRQAAFAGFVEIPELLMKDCRAGEPIDVRVQFVGTANRGRVDVDWFGFSASNDEEVNRIFGLRLRSAP